MDKKRRGHLPGRRMEHCALTGVGCVLYAQDTKRFLFLLRSNDTKHSKTWGLPGGKVEPNETPIDGLRREIYEEIGLTDVTRFVHLETFTSDNEKFVFHTYFGTVVNEFIPTLNHEHVGYCWVPIKEYPRPMHPGVWRSFQFDRVVDKLETIQALTDISFQDKLLNANMSNI